MGTVNALAALVVALVASSSLTQVHGQDVAPIPPMNGSAWVPPANSTELPGAAAKKPAATSTNTSPATMSIDATASSPTDDASAATATASTPTTVIPSAPWNLSIPKTTISPDDSKNPYLLGKDAVAYINSLSSQPGTFGVQTVNSIASAYGFSSAADLVKLLGEDKDFGILKGSNNLFYACSKPTPSTTTSSTTNTTTPRRMLHAHDHHAHHDFSESDSDLLPKASRQLLQLPQTNLADPDPATLRKTATGVPILSSRPAATRKIYLDFDGHTATGTRWNGGRTITVPRFDTDGNPSSFSAAELRDIVAIWRGVAEDFAGFDVDVTTVDPGLQGLLRTTTSDVNYGMRVCIGGSPKDWYNSAGGAVGVALLNSFGAAWSTTVDQPCFAFTRDYNGGSPANAMQTWETISHEVGHTFGLNHDGQTTSAGRVEYYAGHGDWAPIMGMSDYKELSQWSKGEYAGATNPQDDFATIAAFTPFLPDDHGNTAATATRLTSGVAMSGLMGFNDAADFFSFTIATTGSVTARVNVMAPWTGIAGYSRSNLDVQLQLINAQGQVLATSNPTSGSPPDSLQPSIAANLRAAGTYYLSVTKAGQGTASTGYTTYGCVGFYVITATTSTGFISTPSPSPSPSRSPSPSPSPSTVRMTITPNANCVWNSTTSWTLLTGATSYADDASKRFTIPFSFRFGGVDYGNNANSGTWISSNSYITFGGNASAFNVGPSVPALRTVHVASADVSWERVYVLNYGLFNGVTWYGVRFEGYSGWSKRTAIDVVWQVWFTSTNVMQICFGPSNANLASKNPLIGVSDGRNWLAQVNYASVAKARVDITGL